jgi:type IV secretory pathway ATPase VirB11/archaellum biosynthesis ATPase
VREEDDGQVRRTGPTQKIRVLLAEMPRMLNDIMISIITSQDDFVLAGKNIGKKRLLRAAIDSRADVIIAGEIMASEPMDYLDLLYRRPRMKIIAVAADGRRALLHELQLTVSPLEELSPASLIAAIRRINHSDGDAVAH